MSDDQDDLLSFFEEESEQDAQQREQDRRPPWRVLVVDDDVGVHTMTRLALDAVTFHGRGIELLEAYSGREALDLLRRETDIALAFVDVVMETDHAGLDLIRRVREELDNQATRIIVRTGQPGQAPEPKVIVAYDINDYKSKTELTHQKLFSCTIAALRAYEHLMALEASRQGLRRIIDVSSTLFSRRSVRSFAAGVLDELVVMTGAGPGALLCSHQPGFAITAESFTIADIVVLATSFPKSKKPSAVTAPADPSPLIVSTLVTATNRFADDHVTLYLRTPNRRQLAVYLPTPLLINDQVRFLIEVFLSKVAVGFDTLDLLEQLKVAHKATVVALTDMAEGRDTDTGEHVLRVNELAERVARRLRDNGHYLDQLDDNFLEQIGAASMLHDVGKVAIPDRILLKPGRLDPDERAIMETHAAAGGQILAKAAAMVDGGSYLRLGQQIAHHHHEWFDGTGYPDRLVGQEIPLPARITALADVFDALCSQRPYKKAWTLDQALEHIRSLAGRQFDPAVVEALCEVVSNEDL